MTEYAYLIDKAYQFLSVHRKVTAFDPRYTDNMMIVDNYNDISIKHDDRALLYSIIENEYVLGNDVIPINYMMIIHEINMAWCDIIIEMLFEQKNIHTFCGEYGEIISDILTHIDITDKHTMIYRNLTTGDTSFHIAAKTWLHNKSTTDVPSIVLDEIYEIYQQVGEIMYDSSERNCILELRNFNNISLKDDLVNFVSTI